MHLVVAIFVAALTVSACNGRTPTAPTPTPPVVVTPPAPTLVSLSLSPSSGTLLVGDTAPIIITGRFSDNTARTVAANWTSSNPSVATVTGSGVVTGVSAGQTTITASFSGQSIAGVYTIEARLSGAWSGGFFVESCTGTGSNGDVFCTAGRGLTQANTTTQGSLDLALTGSTVSGVMVFGGVRGPVTGVVVNGLMTLQGSLTLSNGPTLVITHWSTNVRVNEMTGFVNLEARYPSLAGVAVIRTRLSGMIKR